ncbi:unnamed protein product [Effrenium voratum]|nr:unnamed protein product [Effrenium voratum]
MAWHADADCEGVTAQARAQWLSEHQGLSPEQAQQQVMQQFPQVFGCALHWDDQKDCKGMKAADRAQWLVANMQLSLEAAQKRVMEEFPVVFAASPSPSGKDEEMVQGDLVPRLLKATPYPAGGPPATGPKAGSAEANPPTWPESVKIFRKGDDYAAIDQIYEEMKSLDKGQFSKSRYAIFFEAAPGKIHEVDVRIGYYTSVYGLGRHPADTEVRSVTSTNETPHPELGSLQNFWRSVENLQTGGHLTYCLEGKGGMLWAVSQAAPLRRVIVNNNLFLWYFRLPPQGVAATDGRYPNQGVVLDYDGWVKLGYVNPIGDFASGGYMANVKVNGEVNLGSQQQFFARNCEATKWAQGAWNFVFVGCPGAPHQQAPKGPVYNSLETSQVIAEKPFIIKESERFKLVVPSVYDHRSGVDFNVLEEEVRDFEGVFVAQPRDSAATINQKLAEGKDVVFTPGIYQLAETLEMNRSGQVLLGLGFATLVSPPSDTPCVQVGDTAAAARISGLMFEAFYRPLGGKNPQSLGAGPEALLRLGNGAASRDATRANCWTFIHDCFARVGGQEAPFTAKDELDDSRPCGEDALTEARCRNMVQINQPCVAGDNLWLWRADHWLSDRYLVYNHENFCSTGLHVAKQAHHVTMYGLFVEHVLSDMTLWEGEDGTTFFYQSELPYDGMDEATASSKSVAPFKSCGYRVGEDVQRHLAVGVGVYAYFRDHDVTVPAGIQAPDRDGVKFQNALTKFLNGGPKTFKEGQCLLQCEKRYGRIQCVIQKGSRKIGNNTDSDKDAPHWASG